MTLAAPFAAAALWLAVPALAQEPVGDTVEASSRTEHAATEIEAEMQRLRQRLQEQRDENRRFQEELLRVQQEVRGLRVDSDPEVRERVAFGDDVRVRADETVEDVVSFGADVFVSGRVVEDAMSFGGNVIVEPGGVVDGDAISFGGEVIVRPGARVRGDRVAVAVPSGAEAAIGPVETSSDRRSLWSSLYHRLILLLSFAGAGVLVIGLFPRRVTRVAQDLEVRPFRSLIIGALASSLIVVFSVLFALLTLGLGTPVSLLFMALLGAAWMLGFIGLCQAIGDRLPFEQKPHGRWLAFLVGTILLSCLGSLPLVGWLVVISASMVGVGAAISSRFGSR